MTKPEALMLIDAHKNKLVDPIEMLNWTWLRVFISCISEEDFTNYMHETAKICSG